MAGPKKKTPRSKSPRRPLESRGQGWAKAIAAFLIRLKVSPNAISMAGLGFAGLGAYALAKGEVGPLALVQAAICIQLRLLCNLMDGMVAIEGGLKSKNGEIFNEVPDRFADLLLLVAAGYALPFAWGPALGWACGVAAVLTAYLRLFGGTLGQAQDFSGPQAKPQRMAALTLGCLSAALAHRSGSGPRVLAITLGLVLLGTLFTFSRRLWKLNRALQIA